MRSFPSGPGLDDDEGAPLPAEAGHEHAHDRIQALIKAMLGDVDLFEVPLEKYGAV